MENLINLKFFLSNMVHVYIFSLYLLKYILSKSYIVKPAYFVLKFSMISIEVLLKLRIENFYFEFRKPLTQDLL